MPDALSSAPDRVVVSDSAPAAVAAAAANGAGACIALLCVSTAMRAARAVLESASSLCYHSPGMQFQDTPDAFIRAGYWSCDTAQPPIPIDLRARAMSKSPALHADTTSRFAVW